nr:hypothetical transcript [Hymenolepis microstoma]
MGGGDNDRANGKKANYSSYSAHALLLATAPGTGNKHTKPHHNHKLRAKRIVIHNIHGFDHALKDNVRFKKNIVSLKATTSRGRRCTKSQAVPLIKVDSRASLAEPVFSVILLIEWMERKLVPEKTGSASDARESTLISGTACDFVHLLPRDVVAFNETMFFLNRTLSFKAWSKPWILWITMRLARSLWL